MIRNERGQSAVVVALLMVVLFGFAALAVDIGAEVMRGIELQRTANAAALAGAQELGAGGGLSSVTQQVYAYVKANGSSASDVSQLNVENGAVTVALAAPDFFYFAPVIGFKSVMINRSATAGSALPGVFSYAIFAGDTSDPGTGYALYVNVNHVNVTGNIHSNADIYVDANNGNGGNNSITGVVEAAGTANVSANVPTAGIFNKAQVLSMPDLSSQVEQQAVSDNQVYPDGWPNGANNYSLSGTIWVEGSTSIDTNNIKGAGCIFATGDITVNANNTNGGDANMAYYSQNGNITIYTNNLTVNGIFYAPKGTISILPENPGSQNNETTTVNGSLVAKDINLNSNQLDIDSASTGNSLMPKIPYLVN